MQPRPGRHGRWRRSTFRARTLEILSVSMPAGPLTFENKPESLIAELQYATHRLLVTIVYRRPGAALFDELFEALSAFIPHYKCVVIFGDFNACPTIC